MRVQCKKVTLMNRPPNLRRVTLRLAGFWRKALRVPAREACHVSDVTDLLVLRIGQKGSSFARATASMAAARA